MVKISKANSRDFEFYQHIPQNLRFEPKTPIIADINGVDALTAFSTYESTGKLPPTRQADLLDTVLCGKANFNLSVKQWKEGQADGVMFLSEIHSELIKLNAPQWCFKLF